MPSGRDLRRLVRDRGRGIAAVALVFTASCALMTFQTPEVIPPGHVAVGAGGALGASPGLGEAGEFEGSSAGGAILGEVAAWGRFGVARQLDVGLKVSSTGGHSEAIFADVKRQSSDGDVRSSFGLGVLGWWDDFDGGRTRFQGLMLVPTGMSGRKTVYIGLRVPIVFGGEHSFISVGDFSVPLGLKLGGPKFLTLLEADIHLPYPIVCLGLGFQYHL